MPRKVPARRLVTFRLCSLKSSQLAMRKQHDERKMMVAGISEFMVAVILFATLAIVVLAAFFSRRR